MAERKHSRWRRAIATFGPGNPIEGIDLDEIFPSQEELNEDRDFNRAMARHYVADFTKSVESNRQVSVDQAKWLGATLTTLNLAGLFAPLQFEGEALFQGIALALFVLGITSSLFGAHIGIRRSLQFSLRLGEIQGYWRAVEHNGFRIRETEISIASLANDALGSAARGYGTGYVSLASFILGAGSTAIAFLT